MTICYIVPLRWIFQKFISVPIVCPRQNQTSILDDNHPYGMLLNYIGLLLFFFQQIHCSFLICDWRNELESITKLVLQAKKLIFLFFNSSVLDENHHKWRLSAPDESIHQRHWILKWIFLSAIGTKISWIFRAKRY